MKGSALNRFTQCALLVLAGMLLAESPAHALPVLDTPRPGGVLERDRPGGPVRRPRVEHGITIDEAVTIAERRYGGRAVGARPVGNGVYRVRILQEDGTVRTVTIR